MKKILSLCMAVVLLLASFTSFAQSDITIELNGIQLKCDVAPQIKNGTTLVPVRAIFEAFGIDVVWSDEHQAVYAESDGLVILFKIGSDKVYVNDILVPAGTAPILYGGKTLVPIRVLCEALGCTVDWDGNARKVIIKSKGYAEQYNFTPVIDTTPAYAEKKEDVASNLITLINRVRGENGLGFVQYDETLNNAALSHSVDMVLRDYFDHVHPNDGISFEQRLDNEGVIYEKAFENLGRDHRTSEGLFNEWMNSPYHKNAILNSDVKKIGLGRFETVEGSIYWTLILVG